MTDCYTIKNATVSLHKVRERRMFQHHHHIMVAGSTTASQPQNQGDANAAWRENV
jgi:hypothetical protein